MILVDQMHLGCFIYIVRSPFRANLVNSSIFYKLHCDLQAHEYKFIFIIVEQFINIYAIVFSC